MNNTALISSTVNMQSIRIISIHFTTLDCILYIINGRCVGVMLHVYNHSFIMSASSVDCKEPRT